MRGTTPPQQRQTLSPAKSTRVKHPPDKASHHSSTRAQSTDTHRTLSNSQTKITPEIDRGRPPPSRENTTRSTSARLSPKTVRQLQARTKRAVLKATQTPDVTHARKTTAQLPSSASPRLSQKHKRRRARKLFHSVKRVSKSALEQLLLSIHDDPSLHASLKSDWKKHWRHFNKKSLKARQK